jgi:hypothetical protein
MKLKVGDIVRVKTKQELKADGLDWDWDWPYRYSQGVLGIVKKIKKVRERFNYYLKFDLKKMFDTNQIDTLLEEEQKEDIIAENEAVPFNIEELVVLKNKIMSLE